MFILQNGIARVLFVFAFLAGGIANAFSASDNGNLHSNLCYGFNVVDDDEFCRQLEHVVAAEIASAVS